MSEQQVKTCGCHAPTCVVCCPPADGTVRHVVGLYADANRACCESTLKLTNEFAEYRIAQAEAARCAFWHAKEQAEAATAAEKKKAEDAKKKADEEIGKLKQDLKDAKLDPKLITVIASWALLTFSFTVTLYILRHTVPYFLDLWFFLFAATTALCAGVAIGLKKDWVLGMSLVVPITFVILFAIKSALLELLAHAHSVH